MKLARLSFFVDEVLAQCAVMGCREWFGLPMVELQSLKQFLFDQLPNFWGNPIEFEPVWSSCIDAIGQACKRMCRNRV